MSRILVDNPVTEQFAMIPNAVWELPCSAKAKAVLGYLLSFNHMAAPRVAQIESVLRIGKKARLAAFAELAELELIRWQYERDGQGRIVAQTLFVTSRPLLDQPKKEPKDRKRQKGATGTESAISPLAVKRPPTRGQKAPERGQNGATPSQNKYNKGPAALSVDLNKFSKHQLSSLRAGNDVYLGSQGWLKAGTEEHHRAAVLLRKTERV